LNKVKGPAAIILLLFFSFIDKIQAQDHAVPIVIKDSTTVKTSTVGMHYNDQLDLIDVGSNLFHKGKGKRVETGEIKSRKLRVSMVPAAGYTLQTGFAVLWQAMQHFIRIQVRMNLPYSQILLTRCVTKYWCRYRPAYLQERTKYDIVIDWRYLYFPSFTYGLGGYTALTDGYLINYPRSGCTRLY